MSSPQHLGLHHLLKFWAETNPDAIAITAPDRSPLSYGQLWGQINNLVDQFNTIGIGRHDRVAIALPNGSEMAVAFLASATCATCAPLNPGYKAPEFDFYLRDLQAKVLIVQAGVDSAAIAVAQALGIPIIELESTPNSPAGIFTLSFPSLETQPTSLELQGLAASEDIALVLHTSGTTSRPKIVPLSHRNLCTSAQNISTTLQLTQSDRCLNVMPLFHIHGLIACLLSSLKAGGSVVCTPGFYAPKFFDWLEEFQPTWYSCVPTMHQAILARSAVNREIIDHTPIRLIRSSSAALAPAVMAEIEAVFKAPVIEAYGMTEAAHQMASNPLPPRQRKPGSVGLAAGPEVSIMDEAGNLLPLGEVGEIVIRGANITSGYENNPIANATAFSNGWFRTGDQGYLDAAHYLFIKDRIKEIINRGGEKISPREVDEIILAHPAIAQAVTFAIPHLQLGEDIAVAVVIHPDQEVTEREIQEFAATQLADFKVPRRVIFLAEIPKGATGKQQRIGLAAKLGITAPESTSTIAFTPPCTPLETALAEIWCTVLRVEPISIEDNFFALGGDSLLAAQVINRVRSQLHLDLSMLSFWQHETLRAMAAVLDRQSPLELPPIQPISQGELLLSFTQTRMWILEQLTPGLAVYNQPVAIHLPQNVNLTILKHSLQEIIRRHAVLRSSFSSVAGVDGQPQQEILPTLTLEVPVMDLSHRAASTAQSLAGEYAQIPFDLSQGGLIRGTICKLNPETQILLLVTHHIIFDGWSVGVFLQELQSLYTAFSQGLPSPLPELRIQYADFALWQQQRLQGEVLRTQLTFWREYLEGAPPLLELPINRPRPQWQTFQGAKETLTLPALLGSSLTTLSRRSNVTLFVTLLTAFGTLLHRYTRAMDIIIGCPVAGRSHLETEGLIGVFINTLPLRLRFEGDPSFWELLQQVQSVSLEAFAHQDLPLEKLIEELQPERNPSYYPLFQVGFILEPPMPDLDFGLAREFPVHNGTAKFDLSLEIEETTEGIVSHIEYSTDLFDRPTITRMLGHFQVLLTAIVTNPEQRIADLPLLTLAEQQLFQAWNSTQKDYPQDQSIQQLFEAQVERTPDAIAVVGQGQSLTYRELNTRSNQLAHYLQSLGVKPEVLVGICVDRSLDMIIGLLGVLKAGGAYVPLDPVYPIKRLEYMVADAQISILLTQQPILHRLPAHQAEVICLDTNSQLFAEHSPENPVSRFTPQDLAYVIYTSGSTGKPKGVLIQQQSVVNFIQGTLQEYDLHPGDRILQFASYSFDVAVEEIYPALSCGATIVLPTDEMLSTTTNFLRGCQDYQITILDLPTAYWHRLTTAIAKENLTLPLDIRLVIIGGERVIPAQFKLWQHHVGTFPRLINAYGPTEATVAMTTCDLSTLDPTHYEREVSIGRPMQNNSVYILDQNLHQVPVGIAGELHIGGVGLARGYLNRPELTAEKFIPNPFDDLFGGRLYKTGDLVRYLPDGSIEYLGRIDSQVKLRGFRIELEGIEALLVGHPAVQEAVVIVREDILGDQRLIAYFVIRADQPFNQPAATPDLRGYLKEKLPDYMIPAAFVPLAIIPLTPSCKIDRQALPIPQFLPSESSYLAPRTSLEEVIANIWAEVLLLEKVGVQDNFFDLGGHSLAAIRVMTLLQEAFGVSLPLRSLFQASTVETLATQVEVLRYVQGTKNDLEINTEYEEFEL